MRVIQGLQLKVASLQVSKALMSALEHCTSTRPCPQDLSSVQEPSAGSQVDVRKLKTGTAGLAILILCLTCPTPLPQPCRAC